MRSLYKEGFVHRLDFSVEHGRCDGCAVAGEAVAVFVSRRVGRRCRGENRGRRQRAENRREESGHRGFERFVYVFSRSVSPAYEQREMRNRFYACVFMAGAAFFGEHFKGAFSVLPACHRNMFKFIKIVRLHDKTTSSKTLNYKKGEGCFKDIQKIFILHGLQDHVESIYFVDKSYQIK